MPRLRPRLAAPVAGRVPLRLNVRARPAMPRMAATAPESFEFQAEVSRVMDIIINSLYSDKDVFLRELVSNAADACDKKRFLALTENKDNKDDLEVRIKCDMDGKKLIIEDTGIGMSKEEMINNLGRIAQSGTKAFSEMIKAKNDKSLSPEEQSNLIGQFGVGFYSGFLVADKISVVTKASGGEQLRWESEAASKYSIATDDSEPIEESGTRLILHLKEDAEKYLDDYTLRDLL